MKNSNHPTIIAGVQVYGGGGVGEGEAERGGERGAEHGGVLVLVQLRAQLHPPRPRVLLARPRPGPRAQPEPGLLVSGGGPRDNTALDHVPELACSTPHVVTHNITDGSPMDGSTSSGFITSSSSLNVITLRLFFFTYWSGSLVIPSMDILRF